MAHETKSPLRLQVHVIARAYGDQNNTGTPIPGLKPGNLPLRTQTPQDFQQETRKGVRLREGGDPDAYLLLATRISGDRHGWLEVAGRRRSAGVRVGERPNGEGKRRSLELGNILDRSFRGFKGLGGDLNGRILRLLLHNSYARAGHVRERLALTELLMGFRFGRAS